MVSNDTESEHITLADEKSRIESRIDIQAYIQDLNYALDHGAKVEVQIHRNVDNNRNEQYTNKFTISDLFPNENPVDALKKELRKLTVEDYIKTVKDTRFKKKSEMREFGKVYSGKDVYIKIRVELLIDYGNHMVFIMSFHYADTSFTSDMFPYRK